MNQVKRLKKLSGLSYFGVNDLALIYDINRNSLYMNIKRWLKQGYLIRLKSGLYVTKEYISALQQKDAYFEFIANKLREPSYLSLEYALQKYGILTESIYVYTSISLKTKRNYINQFGRFTYRNIREDLFTGFVVRNEDSFNSRIATKAKALFDYIYSRTYKVAIIEKDILQSYRFNLDLFSKKDLVEFNQYCKLTRMKKFLSVANNIGEMCDNS